MIGRDKSRTLWRVLKIDRLESSELNICEDATAYSESECSELLRRINEGNKSTGGLKFVINCYGIIGMYCELVHSRARLCYPKIVQPLQSCMIHFYFAGFIKFLGPYYMLLITKRRRIGAICGHTIYAVTKSEMIALPHSFVHTNMANSKNENRSFVHSTCKRIMLRVL